MKRVFHFTFLMIAYAGLLLGAIFGAARGDYGVVAFTGFFGTAFYPMWEEAFDL